MLTIEKPAIYKITGYQFAVLLLLVALARFFGDLTLAYSVLTGGLIQIIPQCWFASLAFRFRGAQASSRILNAFYRGEAGKLLLTAMMFALVFAYVEPLQVPALFVTYFAMAIVYSFGVVRVLKQDGR